jgi:DNA modification methylase
MYHGDCIEVMRGLPEASVHYSVFSPPFASLYTYSSSLRDLGNCANADEFDKHFRYAVQELRRVMIPGRLVSFHCMPLPMSKTRDGFIGARDFPGDMIRSFQAEGFIYHSEVCIWKDPVTAMQRTKAIGLLYKQLCKDSVLSRQGYPDKLITMRAPGDNPEPVTHEREDADHESHITLPTWQRYASPVWEDINPSDTLQYRSAREHDDERHICPLQLQVIRRAIKLWSNKGDVVLSPFAGIGSEGHVALEQGRRFIGIELKQSYYEQASKNLTASEVPDPQKEMFA